MNNKIKYINSPNFNIKKRPKKSIKLIIIHYTGMQSERESLYRLTNPKSKVSSHYLINKNGKIFCLVEENKVAWHAGKSCWSNYKSLNKNSIGIELTNKGHEHGYTNFKKKQLLSLMKISKHLIKKYKIKKNNFIGHSDIAPLRKSDPGEKFPWEKLAKKNIGLWHNCKPSTLYKLRKVKISLKKEKIDFIKSLKKIGYCIKIENKSIFSRNIKAFQRHFRKELINGILDKECLIIAQNLSKKL